MHIIYHHLLRMHQNWNKGAVIMYYLIDLQEKKSVKEFFTKMDLLIHWAKVVNNLWGWRFQEHFLRGNKIDFSALNITGKDTLKKFMPTGKYYVSPFTGLPAKEYDYVSVQRQYQVLDDFGRPVDIRLWTDEIRMIESGLVNPYENKGISHHLPEFRREPALEGAKPHGHYRHLPKMMIQYATHVAAAEFEDDLYELNLTAKQIQQCKPRVRHNVVDADFSIDNKICNLYGRKCWKQQSKNYKQWAKHKSSLKRHNLQRNGGMNDPDYLEVLRDGITDPELIQQFMEEDFTY